MNNAVTAALRALVLAVEEELEGDGIGFSEMSYNAYVDARAALGVPVVIVGVGEDSHFHFLEQPPGECDWCAAIAEDELRSNEEGITPVEAHEADLAYDAARERQMRR